ncbi:TraR/DksA family transcriptional regulator [Ideonella azotifigens]|uniref:TraR/DksA C4-type zinc finger protein n=1 Tax=Ideonella azotifigens TaxID=513160 RepID=A0ABN1K574_9BURK|nr:TraR/DksA family transcriptional regulator [Ideonella azotifigens]MCD2344413.1 TraR/DksA family transcriptional regulator [Ideonella azotifigens]
MNQATDNPSTDASLGTLRELLSFRRSELQSAVQAADLARQQQREQAAPDVMDQKDLGEVEVEAHLVQAHEDRDRFELRQVDQALQRMSEGRFGNCVDCGEPIGMPRLLVQPAAQRCTRCETAHEARAHGG